MLGQLPGAADRCTVVYLPANLHNRPVAIPEAVADAAAAVGPDVDRVFVAYADCGTGGLLDPVVDRLGATRLPGAHCYEFFAGAAVFAALAEAEPGTFYLTDFLARHFDALVVAGLGLDVHPELRDQYFAPLPTASCCCHSPTTPTSITRADARRRGARARVRARPRRPRTLCGGRARRGRVTWPRSW